MKISVSGLQGITLAVNQPKKSNKLQYRHVTEKPYLPGVCFVICKNMLNASDTRICLTGFGFACKFMVLEGERPRDSTLKVG